ncbi:hypothetical protein BP6252_11127 [Coleophoma cylindrospora]|uniref:Uncharacterized protein n=1 Tax=Coleophoma cylindrospora TaxID=1849047 RepID=A0A3D8QP60_9HELO|nr:hypothetical protein BP6252_11127 [Coleophoma cylindrospora]
MPTYVVTGAARGIGLGLVTQLLDAGQTVVAAIRSATPSEGLSKLASTHTSQLFILQCDLASADSVKAFGQELAKKISSVDVLINNAGICTIPEDETPSNLQPRIITEQFNINVIGTLLVTDAVEPLFHAGTKIINISSFMASMETVLSMAMENGTSYGISKAALNMLTVNQALHYTECIVVAIDPGTVATDMNPEGESTVADCAAKMLAVESRLKIEDTGSFLSLEGTKRPW